MAIDVAGHHEAVVRPPRGPPVAKTVEVKQLGGEGGGVGWRGGVIGFVHTLGAVTLTSSPCYGERGRGLKRCVIGGERRGGRRIG